MTPTHAARHRKTAERARTFAAKQRDTTDRERMERIAEIHKEAAASGVCNFDGCEDEERANG